MPPKRAGFGKPIAPPSVSTNPTSRVTNVKALPTAHDERFELQLAKRFDAKCTSIPDGGVCSRYWFPPNKLDELRGVGLNGAGGGGASSPGGESDSTSMTATNSASCTPQHVSPVTVVCKQFGSGQIRAAANVASRDCGGDKDTDAVGDDDFLNDAPHPHQSGGGGMFRSTSSSTTYHHRTHPTTSGSASSTVAAISSDIHTKRLYRDTMPLCLCSAHPHIIDMIGLWHDPILLDNRRSYLLLEDLYYSVTVTPPPARQSVSLSATEQASPSPSSSSCPPSSPPAPTKEERTTFRSTLQHFLQDIQLCPSSSSCRPRQPRNGGDGATVVDGDGVIYCDPVAEEDRLRDERCKLRRRILLAQSVSYTLIHSLAALDVCSIRHRDIKPDNVCMQRADPEEHTSPIIVKLIDFGESYLKRHGAATATTSHTLGGVGDTNGKIAAIEGMPVEERDLQAVGVLIDWILCGGGSEEFKLICEGGDERNTIESKIRGFAGDLRHEDGDIGQQSHPCNNPKFISSSLADMELHTILKSTTSASWLSRYRSLVALRDVLSGLNVNAKRTGEYFRFHGQLRDMIGEEAHVANPDWFYEYYRQSHSSYALQKTPCDLLQHPLFDEFRPFTSNDSLVELLGRWELLGFHPEDPRNEVFNPEDPDRFEPFLAKGPPKEDTMVNRVDRSRLLRSLLQYGAHLQWTSAGTQLDEWSSAMLHRNLSSPSASVSSSPLSTVTNAAASSTSDLSISPPLSTSRLVEPLVKHFTAHSANILSLLLQEAQERLLR